MTESVLNDLEFDRTIIDASSSLNLLNKQEPLDKEDASSDVSSFEQDFRAGKNKTEAWGKEKTTPNRPGSAYPSRLAANNRPKTSYNFEE